MTLAETAKHSGWSSFWLMSRGIASSAIHTCHRKRTPGAVGWQIDRFSHPAADADAEATEGGDVQYRRQP